VIVTVSGGDTDPTIAARFRSARASNAPGRHADGCSAPDRNLQ
jgi:hypothetical protein